MQQPVPAKVGMAGVDQAEIGLTGMDFAQVLQGACGWPGLDAQGREGLAPPVGLDGFGHLLEGAPGRTAQEDNVFLKGEGWKGRGKNQEQGQREDQQCKAGSFFCHGRLLFY